MSEFCWIIGYLCIAYCTQTLTNEMAEGTSWTVQEWKNSGGTYVTSKLTCTEPAYGPYYGKISTNVRKDYSNLAPHYGIIMSIDILLTGYWVPSNYVRVQLDSSTIYSQTNQDTSDFVLSYTYCENNQQFLTQAKQKLVTGLVDRTHSSSNLRIDLQSTFGCTLLLLFSACERFAECHQTCLTCNGPLQTDCLTCPQGVPTSGQCACSTGVSYQNACITSCPQYYIASSNQCIIECSLNCQSCGAQSKCVNCESGYFPVNGQCYSVCPSHASMVNSVCKDYVDQSTYGSTYVAKHFYSDSENIKELSDKFTFTATSSNSILTQQKYSRYNNQFMLGGFGVWSDGSFSISYSGLSPHNQIRLYLTTQVENWSGAQFSIQADTVQIYTQSTLTGTQQVSTQFAHNANTLTIKLISTLSGSSYSGNIAIYKIFIISDQCDQGCAVCGLTACQQCSAPYTLIVNKCIKCGDAYNRNSDCSCKTGYYDNNQLSCSACLTACQTCTNGITCASCNTSSKLTNLPNCDKCVDGYYMELGVCRKCINRCSTCTSANICISCDSVGKFINPPACDSCVAGYDYESSQCVPQCQSGYFKNEFKVCTTCAISCSQCIGKFDNCTECAANRVGWPQCNCPTGGYSRQQISSYCTTCELGVPYAWFSDDLKSIIVDFGGDLKSDLSISCGMLVKEATLLKFGTNPRCMIESKYIVLYLGYNSTILVGNSLLLNQELIQLANCNSPFITMKSVMVNYPNQRLQPIIYFRHQTIQTTSCKPITINIIAQEVNGQRDLQLIGWQSGNNQTTQLILLWNTQLKSKQFSIKPYDLPSNADYIFTLQFTNFLGQGSQSSIKLTVNDQISGSFIFPSGALYTRDDIIILLYPELTPCSTKNRQLSEDVGIVNATLQIKQLRGFGYQLNLNQLVSIGEFHEIHIEQYSLQPNYYYDVGLTLSYNANNTKLQYMEQFTLFVQLEDFICLFNDGNKTISFNQQISVAVDVFNPNTIEQNLTDLQFKWSCTNLMKKEFCRNRENKIIAFNNTLDQYIEPKTFEPYTLLQIIFEVNEQQIAAVIYIIENYIPSLNFVVPTDISNRNNLYDYQEFQFSYQDDTNPDNLLYVAQLYYKYDLVGYFTFHYLQLRFQLWNYLQDSDYEEIRLKVNIYNPKYIMPSSTQVPIMINQPPKQCKITIDQLTFQTMTDLVTIHVTGCIDKDQPLQYQFVYYHSYSDLKIDNTKGTINLGYILQQFSYQSYLQSYLTGNNDSIIMVSIKDSLNGIANISSLLVNSTLPSLNATNPITRTALNTAEQLSLIQRNQQNETLLRYSMLLLIDCQKYPETQLAINANTQIQQIILDFSVCCQDQYQYQIDALNVLYSPFAIVGESQIEDQLNKIIQNIDQLHTNPMVSLTQFQFYQEQQKWFTFAHQLSGSYKQIQQKQSSRRLMESQNSNSTQLFLDGTRKLSNTIMNTQIPNQNSRLIETDTFNISAARFSGKQLENEVGSILTAEQTIGTKQINKQDYANIYDYRLITYETNPYQNDSNFMPFNSENVNYTLYAPNITLANSTEQISISQPLSFAFNEIKADLNEQYSCVSQLGGVWEMQSCKLVQENGENICQCQSVTMVTLVFAFQGIQDKISDFFSNYTLMKMSKCEYYTYVFTYIILTFTLVYFVFLLKGNSLDSLQLGSSKVFPIEVQEDMQTSQCQQNNFQSKHTIQGKLETTDMKSVKSNRYIQQSIPDEKFITTKELQYKMRQRRSKLSVIESKQVHPVITDQDQSVQPSLVAPGKEVSQHYHKEVGSTNHTIGIYQQMQMNHITQFQGLIELIKNFHPILSLYWRFDSETSRVHRSTLIYVSILGQISILVFFGKTLDLNTILVLSIISNVFGTVFTLMILFLAKSENQSIKWIGVNIVVTATCLFIFIVLGSIARYSTLEAGNLWAYSYIVSFILDYCLYRMISLYIKFLLLVKYAERDKIRDILLKVLDKEINEVFYGVIKQQDDEK